ncbi:hypothetical protein HDU96_005383, partial [Phlyctochytrium bullatum]
MWKPAVFLVAVGAAVSVEAGMGRPKQCEILQHKGVCTDVVYAVSSHDNERAHEHFAHIERLKALAPSLMCELAYTKMACAMAFP